MLLHKPLHAPALPTISRHRLMDTLHYDECTGVFTWLEHKDKKRIGTAAGTKTSHGYLSVRIAGKQYYLHRLAWMYVHGSFPAKGLCCDHKNRNRTDNRISNLRLVTRAQNRQNIKQASKNSSGMLGVYCQHGKYVARVTYNHQTYNLGSFDNIAMATIMYQNAKRHLHQYGNL